MSDRVPKLCRHKSSGLAYVTDPASGREHYLKAPSGQNVRHGTAEAVASYAAWVKGFQARAAPGPPPPSGLTVDELLRRHLLWADGYYRKRGEVTSEVANLEQVARRLRAGHGGLPAAGFGPDELRAVRDAMVGEGLARSTINDHQGRVLRVWRWGVAEAGLPPDSLARLEAVASLRKGRTKAAEPPPVPPVDAAVVLATLPHLPAMVRAIVELQWASGMRPGEAVAVRPRDVDRAAAPWRYAVPDDYNKAEHRGRGRVVYLGPLARAALLPWLGRCATPQGWCFPGRKGGHLKEASYRDRIGAACLANGIPPWAPNRLRHRQLTDVRHRHGPEAVQVIGGHAQFSTTEVYAERDEALARRVAEEMG